jgi:hypothetical protein
MPEAKTRNANTTTNTAMTSRISLVIVMFNIICHS